MKNPASVKAFGIHLRRLREDRELSQQELADLSDVNKRTLQTIENGQSSPTFDFMVSLAKGLNTDVKELVDFALPKDFNGKKTQ